MDWSAVLAGGIGGVLGAGATGGFTSWQDRRRERRRLSGAIGMVAVELEENRLRIEDGFNVNDRLTLHDWAQSKATLAEHLEPRNEKLWDGLVAAYSTIHDVRSNVGSPPPVEDLRNLTQELEKERVRLKPRIRFSPNG